ncbi:DUF2802 domain-containing protein [Echinimonas agarilytica]|uniref:DUF2802 domain-containing protein n=1 Tax=Echinimonas agarilytica TaxID=1215918 RepID=A0AA41W4V2_9GAMM|nr:DUF2802 domain-containing protein [Echinimonas agarilytica]MCM2678994.1 DUF2802 domain-containing protein [Echinimonas agarilytica]
MTLPIEYLVWGALALSAFAFLFALWIGKIVRRRGADQESVDRRLNAIEQIVRQLSRANDPILNDIQEIRTGSLAVGRRLGLLEQRLSDLVDQQPTVDDLEPQRRIYSRAVRMVELGADIDEIMQECELPRAEAELIVNLHTKN